MKNDEQLPPEKVLLPVLKKVNGQFDETLMNKTVNFSVLNNGQIRMNLKTTWFEEDVENGSHDIFHSHDYDATPENFDLMFARLKAHYQCHLEKNDKQVEEQKEKND